MAGHHPDINRFSLEKCARGLSHNGFEIFNEVRLIAIATFVNQVEEVFFILLQDTSEKMVDAGDTGQGFGIDPNILLKMPAQPSFGPFTFRQDFFQGAKRAVKNNVAVHHIHRQYFKRFLQNLRDVSFENPDHILVFRLTYQVLSQSQHSGKWNGDERFVFIIPQVEATQARQLRCFAGNN